MKRTGLLLLLLITACRSDQDRLTDEQALQQAAPGQEQVAIDPVPGGGSPASLPQEPGAVVYKALGTEPGWALSVRENATLYQGLDGQLRLIEATPPGFAPRAGTYRSGRLAITIAQGPCSDGLSPHRWRDRVTVAVAGGQTAHGCGGGLVAAEVASGDWAIVSINGRPTSGDPRYYSLALAGDELRAAFGCNSFAGGARQTGDRLTIERLIGTQRGCAEPARSFERDALAVLNGNPQIERTDGRTRLVSGTGTIELAPRQKEGPRA